MKNSFEEPFPRERQPQPEVTPGLQEIVPDKGKKPEIDQAVKDAALEQLRREDREKKRPDKEPPRVLH